MTGRSIETPRPPPWRRRIAGMDVVAPMVFDLRSRAVDGGADGAAGGADRMAGEGCRAAPRWNCPPRDRIGDLAWPTRRRRMAAPQVKITGDDIAALRGVDDAGRAGDRDSQGG